MTTGRERRRLTATTIDVEVARQRAFLVGVVLPGIEPGDAETSLEELRLLADTAGSEAIDAELLRRAEPRPATLIGSGQAAELAQTTASLDIDVVVFDNDLSPAQQRNLQKIFGCDVVDRQALILDVFAQHATSREGMLQVELALLSYHLPRLRGKGTELSRLGAGIGTRGPGETKLETDRRRILDRVAKLRSELRKLHATRQTQRKARRNAKVPQAALVGYTNAGKSTLLNRLTSASVLTEDRLFTTLGSTVRRMSLSDDSTVLLSDTVGFVKRLPHQLIESFRSTLDEVVESDLLVHVVDAADPNAEAQHLAVREVLADIGASSLPELLVFNKIDLADPVAVRRLTRLHPGSLAVSALEGEGVSELREHIGDALREHQPITNLLIPYERGDVLARVHEVGSVVAEEHEGGGTRVVVRLPLQHLAGFGPFLSEASSPNSGSDDSGIVP